MLFCLRDGDVYAAMRDCYQALTIDPYHMKVSHQCNHLYPAHVISKTSIKSFIPCLCDK